MEEGLASWWMTSRGVGCERRIGFDCRMYFNVFLQECSSFSVPSSVYVSTLHISVGWQATTITFDHTW